MSALAGVGPARAQQLAAAGVVVVRDVLWHLPVRWEDRRHVEAIASLSSTGAPAATVAGKLSELRSQRLPGRRVPVARAVVDDGTATVRAVWFGRPYLARQVAPGVPYLLSGPLRAVGRGLELVNPSLERWTGVVPSGPTAVYARLGALGPAAVRRLVAAALEQVALDPDPLPPELLERHGLPTLAEALRRLHLPAGADDVAALEERRSPGHRRLAYGEWFAVQLRLAVRRERSRRRVKPQRYVVDERVRSLARAVLPYRLTAAQRASVRTIVEDLRAEAPMARLLQGDVGSGKTIVAAMAMLVALASRHQVAFMAPTELLAEQHRRTLGRLLGERFAVGLLTRSSSERVEVARRAAAGEPMLVVGTQALLEAGVSLPRLALVVIDEQHRFGVAQRQRLATKGRRPDLLVMTATPIPRSLAMVLYGDLDLSVLDELPAGRATTITRVSSGPLARQEALDAIRRHRGAGGQTYVVFPRIDSDDPAVPGVEREGRWYLAQLPDCRSAVLTGRTPAAERDRLLSDLAAGRLDVLVATTVIEVGLDVPGATLMVVEGAEHFGLSQLHQLRGRVGRGGAESECLALSASAAPEAARRLATFAACSDGFRIAEADLELRGPGDLLGIRQSGLEALRVADPWRHADLLEAARADARELAARLDQRALGELASVAGRGAVPEAPQRPESAPCQDAAR